ncbi:MAG: enoyl-CoA hydratase-related protein [Dehalococcoidia bacterium]|jgi:enoyl-CoA hydratase/carnithine racemase
MPVVLYEKRGQTVIITLNRPDAMNAINDDVRREFKTAMLRFRDDDAARTAIVTGAGDKAFSAGADLKEMSARHAAGAAAMDWNLTPAVLMRQMELWKPVIGAINGFCLAGGLEIALACDIRIGSENSSFALTEVTRGIIPGNGGTQLLSRVVPLGMALQMMFTGERISAEEACRIGLVNRVVPQAELMAAAEQLAERINESAPVSVRLVKELALKGLDLPLMDGLRLESMFYDFVHGTEDAKEGPLAFAEKRKAEYKGR